MNGNYIAACIITACAAVATVLMVRATLRGRRWKGDGTWLMVFAVALVGTFVSFGSFAAANVQERGHDCRIQGGKFVRYLGCVDPATNAPLPVSGGGRR